MKKKGLKILIMGLPGAGKTALADELASRIRSAGFFVAHYNADEVRASINCRLQFSKEDREHQAFTMGWLADRVAELGGVSICDFVCPTDETRKLFGRGNNEYLTIFVDRIEEGRFEDTNKVFTPPQFYFYRVEADGPSVKVEVDKIFLQLLRGGHLSKFRLF